MTILQLIDLEGHVFKCWGEASVNTARAKKEKREQAPAVEMELSTFISVQRKQEEVKGNFTVCVKYRQKGGHTAAQWEELGVVTKN